MHIHHTDHQSQRARAEMEWITLTRFWTQAGYNREVLTAHIVGQIQRWKKSTHAMGASEVMVQRMYHSTTSRGKKIMFSGNGSVKPHFH